MKEKCTPQIFPEEEQIRLRAYQLYESRGCQNGNAMDDWLQAEYELIQLPIAKIAELKPEGSPKSWQQTSPLIALVHAAMLVGVNAMSHVQRCQQ